MDALTKERRSWNMSRIRGRNTKPELVVRSMFYRLGYRFRLHRCDLPGKPDLVLPRHRVAILVHGCFWHRHRQCKYAYTPKSNLAFWRRKFAGNVERDAQVRRRLRKAGWVVAVIWECQTADADSLARRASRLMLSAMTKTQPLPRRRSGQKRSKTKLGKQAEMPSRLAGG